MSNQKLFIVCTGLGLVNRGFETYITDLSEMLSQSKNFNYTFAVFSAGRFSLEGVKTVQVPAINRNSKFLHFFTKNIHSLFSIEQISFFFPFLFYVFIKKPKLIYLGEYNLYCYLFKIRKLFKLKYSLALYTGGQATPGLYDPKLDYVHHITDIYISELLKSGIPSNKQFLIPHFIRTNVGICEKLYSDIILKAGAKKIVLSVGSLDNSVKRLKDLALLLTKVANCFPVFLGDYTPETKEIEQVLLDFFGEGNFILKKVPRKDLPTYYSAALVLVSCSLHESFGLVNLEAFLMGTEVIYHEYQESKFVLKGLSLKMNLKDDFINIKDSIESNSLNQKRIDLRKFVFDNYDSSVLLKSYENMFSQMINN